MFVSGWGGNSGDFVGNWSISECVVVGTGSIPPRDIVRLTTKMDRCFSGNDKLSDFQVNGCFRFKKPKKTW